MSEYLLINFNRDIWYLGNTEESLVLQVPECDLDLEHRRLVYNGKPDTVSFSDEFDESELRQEYAKRAIKVLCTQHGWSLFQATPLH